MSVAEVRACSTSNTMKPEQKVAKPEEEGHESLDNIISQDIERDSFLSFSRTGGSSVHWIQYLHGFDQYGISKFSDGTKVDSCVERKGHGLDLFNGVSTFPSESVHSIKSNGLLAKGTKSTSQQIQALNIPEAVAAFVQAAAKTNAEPEKYIPGWPLLSPSKVQLQKCDKCLRDFCSTINYRRHIRVHRRSLNIEKDSPKNRGLLGAFWDKLSLDDAKEILSFKNVAIEEITGSSVIGALTSLIRKPVLYSLPELYGKAGRTLLEVVQARPFRLPISSQELFDVLDDASEKTFLCAGTAQTMQKFVFDGQTGKIALEIKNIIACISFMLEQILVKAWLADKDAEALRCQKLLVEEEEATQRRQAEILERKRLKKLRQKEKERTATNKADHQAISPEPIEGTSGSTGIPSPRFSSESSPNTSEASLNQAPLLLDPARMSDCDLEAITSLDLHTEDANQGVDHRSQIGSGEQAEGNLGLQPCTMDADHNVDHQLQTGRGQRQSIPTRWPTANPTRNARNGSYMGQVPAARGSVSWKHGSYRSQKTVPLANAHKVWTRKSKPENEEEGANDRVDREHREHEVMIGSINVRLGVENGHDQHTAASERNNSQQKLVQPDPCSSSVNRSEVKLWRPVGRHHHHQHGGDSAAVLSDQREHKADGLCAEAADHDLPDVSRHAGAMDDRRSASRKDSSLVHENGGPILFSSQVAEAFLVKRWKEAIASDHVVLVICSEAESSESILENAETRTAVGSGSSELGSSCGGSNPKFAKPEKGYMMKYAPKQRNNVLRVV